MSRPPEEQEALNSPAQGSDTSAQEPDSPVMVLRNRKFLALWLAQLATQVGYNMVLYGMTVQVVSLSEPGFRYTGVSLLFLSFLVPAVLVGAIAGVYVDRLERRMVLVASNLVRAGAFLALLFLGDQLLYIYIFTMVIATATTFFGPAEAAMIPVLVARRQLLAANSLYIFTLQAAFFAGFAVLGPVVVNLAAGPDFLLVLVAALFIFAGWLCWQLPTYHPQLGVSRPARALGEAGSAVASTFSQLRDGLVFIRDNPPIFWPLTYLGITASLVGVLGVLGPGYAIDTLGLTERDFVVVVFPLGMGLIMGVLALNVYGRNFSRRRGIEAGLIVLGVALIAMAVAGPVSTTFDVGPLASLLTIVVIVAFIAGIAYAFIAVPAQTQLQEELPPGIRGRVFGVLNVLISLSSLLPIVIIGPIADQVGPGPVLQVVALLVLLAAAGSILKAHPGTRSSWPAQLVEPLDPVSASGRSLTQPVALNYIEGGSAGEELSYVASPVVPGRSGPATIEELEQRDEGQADEQP